MGGATEYADPSHGGGPVQVIAVQFTFRALLWPSNYALIAFVHLD